jgi:general stress protein YciG
MNFRDITPEQRREIGSRGGKAAHANDPPPKRRKTRTGQGRGWKGRRGFAAMDPDRVREIARLGGNASAAKGAGHRWAEGSDEPKEAGRKGGQVLQRRRREAARS